MRHESACSKKGEADKMRWISPGCCDVPGCDRKVEWIGIEDNLVVGQRCNRHFPPKEKPIKEKVIKDE